MVTDLQKMLTILVMITIVAAGGVHCGYEYRKPIGQFNQTEVHQLNAGYGSYVGDNIVPESHAISYTVSHPDYNYLRQHKEGPQEYYSSYHAGSSTVNGITNYASNTHQSLNAQNTPQLSNNFANSNQLPIIQRAQSSYSYDNSDTNNLQNTPQYIQPINHDVARKNSYQLQNIQQSSQSNVGEYNYPESQAPAIIKHIYFHVPPPDVEEAPKLVVAPPPPKKHYNIVFIKVPSQDPRKVYIQSLLQNRLAEVEDKTLIYVLVNEQEPQQQAVLQEQVTSKPEVFYVKYKGDVNDVVTKIDGLIETDLQDSPVLQPGLVNGH